MAPRRKPPVHHETSLRHVWLASLGLAVVAQRETLRAGERVVVQADGLRRRALAMADDARSSVIGGLDSVRGQVEPRVVQFSTEVEARLAPVLDKLGLKPASRKRPARKTAARKRPAGKATARKPASRATRRA